MRTSIGTRRPAAEVGSAPAGAAPRLGRWVAGLAGGGLAGFGVAHRSPAGAALALAGGALAYGGLTGKAPLPAWLLRRFPQPQPGDTGLQVRRAVTILRPADELYALWRDLSKLPQFMG